MRSLRRAPRPTALRQPGVTIVELLVALALFGVVGGALLRAFDRQARFHTGVVQLLQARQQLVASHDVIGAEFRSLATVGDIERLTDTALVYRTALGGGIVCRIGAAAVDLAPDRVASGVTLARTRTAPQPGDTVWLHDEGVGPGAADDRWHPAEIASAGRRTDACLGTAYVDSALDRGLSGWRIVFAPGTLLPPTIGPGTVARVTRRARFALYRAASGESNLGWADWNAALWAWNTIQPVTGPFLPVNRGAPHASGVAFAGRDTVGSVIAPPVLQPALAAISLVTRAQTDRAVRMDGGPMGRRADSLRSTTALRNTP